MRGRHVIGIRDDERMVLATQEIEYIIVEPGGMAKLKGGARSRWQLRQESLQPRQILLHVWRQLKQDDAKLVSKHCSRFQEILRFFFGLFQSFEMGNPLRRFE